jgi:hypothetical protein
MALTATTISAAITAMDNVIQVTSGTSVTAGQIARIDNEYVKIQGVNGTSISVMRGVKGTKSLAHNALANFVHGPQADFPVEMFPLPSTYTHSASGAIAVAPGFVKLTKAGVGLMTLAAPTTAQSGLQITILTTTAQAHTVTATFAVGTVATFTAAIGNSITLVAIGGAWYVLYANGVTVA